MSFEIIIIPLAILTLFMVLNKQLNKHPKFNFYRRIIVLLIFDFYMIHKFCDSHSKIQKTLIVLIIIVLNVYIFVKNKNSLNK